MLIVLAILDLFECVDERVGLVLDIQLWDCDCHWSYANWVNRLINSLWHRCVGALKKPHPVKGRADVSSVEFALDFGWFIADERIDRDDIPEVLAVILALVRPSIWKVVGSDVN